MLMGGRYGGEIKRSGKGQQWSRRRALEAVGREARQAFGWKTKDPPMAKGSATPA